MAISPKMSDVYGAGGGVGGRDGGAGGELSKNI